MNDESVSQQLGAAIREGRHDGGSFFGSILAGTLLGLGLDALFDTAPILVIVGVVLGSYAGFSRAWHEMKSQPEHPAKTLQHVEEGSE